MAGFVVIGGSLISKNSLVDYNGCVTRTTLSCIIVRLVSGQLHWPTRSSASRVRVQFNLQAKSASAFKWHRSSRFHLDDSPSLGSDSIPDLMLETKSIRRDISRLRECRCRVASTPDAPLPLFLSFFSFSSFIFPRSRLV